MNTDRISVEYWIRLLVHRGQMVAVNSVGGLFWLPRNVRSQIYRSCGIQVGRGTQIFPGLVIRPGQVSFGARCFVNTQCLLDPGSSRIVVGDDVFIGARAIISATTHMIGPSGQRAGANVAAPIHISKGSWLGAGVTVLPGVTIGEGCIIGAGSVVTESTVPNTLNAGVPARLMRSL